MSLWGIAGHEKEIGLLKAGMASGRLAHSFIFSGPEGMGKKTVAEAFAKALNCEAYPEGPCEKCRECLLAENNSHPNIIHVWPVDKDGHRDDSGGVIKIDQIRQVQEMLWRKAQSGIKAVIIDLADKLKTEAANAFLKTLEEPPSGSVIILVTSKPSELLPTVVSRCQRISFRPLPDGVIAGFLAREYGMGPNDSLMIARLSAGSLARAIKYSADNAHAERKELARKLAGLKPGSADEALKLAEEFSKRDDLEEVLEFIKNLCRDRLVCGEGMPELMVNSDLAVPDAGRKGLHKSLIDAFEMAESARRDILPPRYANKQLALELLFMRLAESRAFS